MTGPNPDSRDGRLEDISILYFIDAPYYGGAERYLLWIAEGARDQGASVRFLLRQGGSLGPLRRELERLDLAYDEIRVDITRNPATLWPLYSYFRSHSADLLHANLPAPYMSQNGLVAPVARSAGIPRVVTTEHLPRIARNPKRAWLKRFSTYFVDRVITVSRANARHLEWQHDVGPERIRVVYNGVPEPDLCDRSRARKELDIPEGVRFLCLIGELSARKGQRLLLDALARLHRRDDWCLWFVGEGPDRYILEQRVDELGMGSRVVLAGFRDDVSKILRAADLLVLPSELEGMPYVILEAMAMGLPVIATNVDGVPEIVVDDDTGLLIEPGDVEALSAAVQTVLDRPEMARRWGEAGRKRYLEGFRLELSVARTVDVYREILD